MIFPTHGKKQSSLTVYIWFFSISIAFLSISRLALAGWQYERVTETQGWLSIMLQGLRIDIATLCLLLFVPIILSFFIPNKQFAHLIWDRFVQVWLTICAYILVFMEFATPSFILEYNVRPNRLFVEYLIYPKEVFSMLLKSNPFELLLVTLICLTIADFVWRRVSVINKNTQPTAWQWRGPLFVLSFLVLVIGGRSTFGHRPINPAMVYFSTDPLVNSLSLNSLYSTAFATYQMLLEDTRDSQYGNLPEKKIIEIVRNMKSNDSAIWTDTEIPTLSQQIASYKGKSKNLVIILEESLGSRFVGSLGGLPLTPNFDQLSNEGWNFNSMLATGTRSVRGIEAVVTGFTPTPDRSVVKLGKSQHHFFTIAELLQRRGYHTEFIYGGESHFDNMKSFFLGNGFKHITEEKDYVNPKFVGSWGVSDEDLFNKAHQKFKQFSENDQPFFSLVFTSSNHSPFEYPNDRISEPYAMGSNNQDNAIQYADWALGDFFKKAKSSEYWKNTVFLVIADHDARTVENGLVPVKSFHIPALIIGNGIPSRQDHRIASQLDMPVTMLSLIGADNYNPMLGRDLSNMLTTQKARAFMQYGQNFGFIEGNEMVILQPEKAPLLYSINQSNFELKPQGKPTKELAEKALAVSLWGKLAYKNLYFRLPEESQVIGIMNYSKHAKNSAP